MAAGHRTKRSAEVASMECSEERISDGSFHKHLAGLLRGAYRMKRSGYYIGGDSSLKQVRKIDSFISPAVISSLAPFSDRDHSITLAANSGTSCSGIVSTPSASPTMMSLGITVNLRES